MRPSEAALFTAKEQELLVETRADDLDSRSEDELIDLLSRVRRARNKYSDLHRRQAVKSMKKSGRRAVTADANERTLKKAEIFDDAVSRVARYVSRAARANADEAKQQRIAAARDRPHQQPPKQSAATGRKSGATKGKTNRDVIDPTRKGAVSARGKRSQARKDNRTRS